MRILSAVLVLLLSGCGFFSKSEYRADGPDVSKTIAALPAVESDELPLESPSLETLVSQLEQLEVESYQYDVANRLAQLRLMLMEEQLAEGDADFEAPLNALNRLRDLSDSEEERSKVEYQLARVHELSASRTKTSTVLDALSTSIELTESQALELEGRFRRAELYFSNDDFTRAEQDFVIVAATEGEYQLHASYMLCWVRFKLGYLDEALDSAVSALSMMAASDSFKASELKQDLLRVTVLALNDAEGPETLRRLMDDAGKPDWQTDLYRALGDWYLEKTRYADSAETWQAFLADNPLDQAAPGIALEVIDTQRQAGFVSDIPDLELVFIERYGKQSAFFDIHGESIFSDYSVSLKGMLDRHTQRLHAHAQSSEARADFQRAAEAYELWLVNFDASDDGQQKRFLYAELLEKAFGVARAIPQYEMVFAADSTSEVGREAAYATVLGYTALLGDLGVEPLIEANLQFATTYPDDERAANCFLSAAKHLFDDEQYERANEVALYAQGLRDDSEYRLVINRLIAHSSFELSRFERAELAYRELLALGEDSLESLLVSVYKQGEMAELSGDLNLAIAHYERLWEIDPNATLTRDAGYDVAALHESLNEFEPAIAKLVRYRDRYPEQAVAQASEISRRLVFLKETLGDLAGAADELLLLSESSAGEESRVSRYRAAELYLQIGDLEQAIIHFRFYAHNFSEPVAMRFEAMHHMDELYQQTGESNKRMYWLRKKRDLYLSLVPKQQSDRAKQLAASAMYVLSESDFVAYQNAKLSLPLAQSLKKKQTLLNRSLENYQQIVSVGAYDFVSLSYFRMAKLYEILASDLLSSEIPGQLNDLERSQYEILLEEQAYPFEEKAISLHQENLQLGWQLGWNDAVKDSLAALENLSPAQFRRPVMEVSYVHSSD